MDELDWNPLFGATPPIPKQTEQPADTGVPPTRQVSAGTGLTGGGDLSADRVLSVDFGVGHNQVMRGDTAVGGGSAPAYAFLAKFGTD